MKTLKTILSGLALVFVMNTLTAQEETTPLQHVLLFDWKDDAAIDQKEQVLALFKRLLDKINGYERITIEDVKKSSGNFDIVLILEFISMEALKAYEVHPDHVKISELAPPLLSGFLEFDFYGNF